MEVDRSQRNAKIVSDPKYATQDTRRARTRFLYGALKVRSRAEAIAEATRLGIKRD